MDVIIEGIISLQYSRRYASYCARGLRAEPSCRALDGATQRCLREQNTILEDATAGGAGISQRFEHLNGMISTEDVLHHSLCWINVDRLNPFHRVDSLLNVVRIWSACCDQRNVRLGSL